MIRQVAALPYRRSGKGKALEILLVSSRRTGRWIIPKGNIDAGRDEPSMAALEALEEAGVEGKLLKRSIGSYDYLKFLADGSTVPSEVTVYALAVRKVHERWLEQDQRQRRWTSVFEASELVDEPSLAALLLAFSATAQRS